MTLLSKRTLLALGAAGLLVLLGGCSDEVSTPDATDGTQTIDLDDPFGGFLPQDEDPAFGDEELAATASDEERVENGYEGLSLDMLDDIQQMEQNSATQWYSFTALWGFFDAESEDGSTIPPEQGEEIVWDGYMELSRGGIKLLSIILFEGDQGDQIQPRTTPQLLEWSSRTYGHFDGVRVLLTIPPDTSRVPEPVELAFHAGEYERVFTIEELDSLSEVIEISETAMISFRSFEVDPAADVHGFLGGRWGRRAAGDSVGFFKGCWIAARDGRPMGWLRGHYGVNSQGEQVFFGKYIDWTGRFRGILRGHYDVITTGEPDTPEYAENGTFWGEWVDRHGRALGRLEGAWVCRGSGRGRFYGMWRGNVLTPPF